MIDAVHHPRRMLVTGGAGFIGCNFVRLALAEMPEARLVNLDALTYAGSLANLTGIGTAYPKRYRFVHGDILDQNLLANLFTEEEFDTVVHFAAESHVDRSIDNAERFLETNVTGTYRLLETAREAWGERQDVRFHHISTDEVFGSLGTDGAFVEDSPYDPSSPYSASKAAADHLVQAWHRTYGLPVTLSNCSNNYGPYQFPEKLIPLTIIKALAEEPLPIYGDGGNVRDWLHVEDHCSALVSVLTQAPTGRVYNIGARCEMTNLELVLALCDALARLRPRTSGGAYRDLITFVADRPGHDRRYAIDPTRLETDLGWRPSYRLEDGLTQTVRWYLDHGDWIDRIRRTRYDGGRLGLASASGGTS